MLDAHPDLAIPPESYFIIDLYRRQHRYRRRNRAYDTIVLAHDLAASRPFDDFDTNAVGTLNMLDATRQTSPKAVFVQMSTLFIPSDVKYVGGLLLLIVILVIRPQGILGSRARIG